ncbi:uncharacterized protein [Physcomitrium patens]|uniref:Glycosyl transferase family 3 N-terminal domain-containing protein n=2 Tax=Physcomitrium patens TaxID=3218 RepID=A0A2K1JZQ3_PHYPA|nr:uncharacterized protein LOC112287846 isoform X2 [Physcomitrium patens]PNR46999.1 hypothetical protein PHYPA_014119 [Physcomitrium patens]|eukprot:XP_024387139.1 uncharacterized protein LOC112287846 isoform X2 [Physcomitrella patens]
MLECSIGSLAAVSSFFFFFFFFFSLLKFGVWNQASMEAMRTTSLARPLSWKDSISSFLHSDYDTTMQLQRGKSGPGLCAVAPSGFGFVGLKGNSRSNQLCPISRPIKRFPQCCIRSALTSHYYLGPRRPTSARAIAGKSAPSKLSDDSGENRIQARAKRLQDAVGPNKTLLDAQARVCTGPTQTRPLDEAQAYKVLNTVLQSGRGELPDSEKVSKAQLGAFFGAMTLRANCFPPPTRWSDGERKAMSELWPALSKCLPEEVLFLADPEGSIMGEPSDVGPNFSGKSPPDVQLVSALRRVMGGGHLEQEELANLLRGVLPLQGPKGEVSDALLAAFMICSRMNGETEGELNAYCMAFDDELDSLPVAKVKSLTHYGEPYDGNTRFFRSSLFVAAVRASYGETCLLHGVDWMPPKGGVTEEQMLKYMGANTSLTLKEAVKLLEDKGVGFAYISQREARPSLHSLVDLREHIKKRPPIATTEKVQRYIKATGREAMIASFYHEGYEDPLLMLIRRRGVKAGLVVKGEEGALSLTTKDRSPDAVVKGRPLNYVAGFRPQKASSAANNDSGVLKETFTLELNARDYGIAPTSTPRVDRSVEKNVELGMAALRGEKGPAYDRIVLNAAVADHLLGCEGAESPLDAIERAKEAIDSGRALNAILHYIDRSKWPAGTPSPSTT